jgi:hypothetical protein
MTDPHAIRSEIDRLTARRTSLWCDHAGVEIDARIEIAALTERIDALWKELRLAHAEVRVGPRDRILTSARRSHRAEQDVKRRVRG